MTLATARSEELPPPVTKPNWTLHQQGVFGRSGVCSTFSSSAICFGQRPHAPAARHPCQNLTAIHTHQLWFPLLLLTVLRGWHLFWNKGGPCIFTQVWGQGAAQGVRHWTCFTFVYQHFRLYCASPYPTLTASVSVSFCQCSLNQRSTSPIIIFMPV